MNNTEKITKEEVIESQDQGGLILYLVQNNPIEYNLDKAIEEAIEFAEVLIKLKTKSKSNPKRPKEIEAIKEFGDVVLRGSVALMHIFQDDKDTSVDEALEAHISEKCAKLISYLKKGSYKGGL